MAAAQSIVEHTVPLSLALSSGLSAGGFVGFVVWRFANLGAKVRGMVTEIKTIKSDIHETKEELAELRRQNVTLETLVVEIKNTNDRIGRMDTRIGEIQNHLISSVHNRRVGDDPE